MIFRSDAGQGLTEKIYVSTQRRGDAETAKRNLFRYVILGFSLDYPEMVGTDCEMVLLVAS
jgi:hypothetical protein